MYTRLLSVDWDFFFPTNTNPKHWGLWDWSHKESSFFINNIWGIRAAGFDEHNIPRPKVNDEWQTFWGRFEFTDDCKLFYAESHAFAAHETVYLPYGSVWNFDAHADCGYNRTLKSYAKEDVWHCEDWMILYHKIGSDLQVRYPRWKTWAFKDEPTTLLGGDAVRRRMDTGGKISGKFDRIFVCRSGAWVPPWSDAEFADFIARCPVKLKLNLDNLKIREFSEEDVAQYVEQTKKVKELHLAGKM